MNNKLKSPLVLLIVLSMVLSLTPKVGLAETEGSVPKVTEPKTASPEVTSPNITTKADATKKAISPHLDYLEFIPADNRNLTVGVQTSVNLRLFDDIGNPYNGSVIASITDLNGNVNYYSVIGSQGIYTIHNITVKKPGEYSLAVWDAAMAHAATGTITALNANLSITGVLVLNDNNSEHKVTVKLTDSYGNILADKSLVVDASEAGIPDPLQLTTDEKGIAEFSLTPKTLGMVKLIFGGQILGSLKVQPAEVMNSRIGESTESNTAMSIALAQAGWSETTNVILARDDLLTDAMSAVPLSKKLNAPILVTSSAKLDPKVLTEIKSLGAINIYIIGGTVAVQPEVESELKDSGLRTFRFAGYDCFETAAKVADWVGDAGTVYLANGTAVPDSLAISAFAAQEGNSILLTNKDKLPDVTKAELKVLAPKKVVIIGGTAVVSKQVEGELRNDYTVDRWGGWDRYGTQQVICQKEFNSQSPLYIASSLVKIKDKGINQPLADALLASTLAAKNGGFVIALPPLELPKSISTFLLNKKGLTFDLKVVGNNSSISPKLEEKVRTLLTAD